MSTLAEIEAAVEKLPSTEQKALLEFISDRVCRAEALQSAPDSMLDVIGAFHSGTASTGEDAEDILYGHDQA